MRIGGERRRISLEGQEEVVDSGEDSEEPSLPVHTKPTLRNPWSASSSSSSEDQEEEEEVLTLIPRRKEKVEGKPSWQTNFDGTALALPKTSRPPFLATEEQRRAGALWLDQGVQVPASINIFLRDYQRQGIRFFYQRYKENRGGLLGDDMGLGKTIQVIGFLAAIMGKKGHDEDDQRRMEAVRSGRLPSGRQKSNRVWETALIICPSSVVDNWRSELDTWGYFEHASVNTSAVREFERGRLDVLVTSHEMASNRIQDLEGLDLSCVVVDEVHKLKNPRSKLTLAMNRFRCRVRFGLTGTAIQNSYRELYTIADWTNPGLLGSEVEWVKEIEEPLKRGQRKDASPEQLADSRTRADKLVKNVLPLFFLRRTKDLIKDQLPRKFDKIVFCPLTRTQLGVYRRILSEPEVDFMRKHADPCECGRTDEGGLPLRRQNCCHRRDERGNKWNQNMLKYIYLLQKCSNHVALVFPDPDDRRCGDPERESRYARQVEYVRMMFPEDWEDKRCNARNGMNEELCGKWKVLAGLLRQWKKDGDKVLVFSMNLRLLQFIEFFMVKEGYDLRRLDGSTPQAKRQSLVNQFNSDPSVFVFLISTTAGGTGLNLTAANKVVVFDPHWNPSHDLQAMDRAYRFGQTRDVNVYRLIGAGSLEECVYGRQIYKQQQMQIGYEATKERRYFEGVAGDKDNMGELFGCKNLFRIQETSTTKAIIDDCNINEIGYALERFVESFGTGEDLNQVDLGLSRVMAGETERVATTDPEEGTTKVHRSTNQTPANLKGKASSSATVAGGGSRNEERDDPIKNILDNAGVTYTHLNDEITGGSRAEAEMSKQAQLRTTAKRRAKTQKPSGSKAPWPPPRPREGVKMEEKVDQVKAQLEQAEHALERVRPRNGPTLSLSILAKMAKKTEAELAGELRRMSEAEMRRYFQDSIDSISKKGLTDMDKSTS
ncbi:hypothetical protein IE53DRAFT_328772 [Violaceomyces palustris]|uniref:Uncharacterized protein n=1 Tax=Violaceomyces palustris TaxID=1673888 RepID=A0ACD0NZK1_9BASI|nr:hypothetical protein IE53DRAFT_328772 [Violaceomyces palustris]